MRRLQSAAYAAKGVQDSCRRQQNPLRVAMPGCQLHVPALTWQIRLVGVAAGCVGGPDLALGEDCWDSRWPQGVLVMVAARREAARARAAPQAHRHTGLGSPAQVVRCVALRNRWGTCCNWRPFPSLREGRLHKAEMVGQGSTPTPSEANVLYLRVRHRPIQPVPGEPRPCRLVAFEC